MQEDFEGSENSASENTATERTTYNYATCNHPSHGQYGWFGHSRDNTKDAQDDADAHKEMYPDHDVKVV